MLTRISALFALDSVAGGFLGAALLSYYSTIAELQPGDIIATGTPGGVGSRRKPPVWMKAGDVLEVEIGGLGTLRNPIVDRQLSRLIRRMIAAYPADLEKAGA